MSTAAPDTPPMPLFERAEAVWRDIRPACSASVARRLRRSTKWQDARSADGARVRTAVRWTPKELSLVAIPADVGATTREDEPHAYNPTPECPSPVTAGNPDSGADVPRS